MLYNFDYSNNLPNSYTLELIAPTPGINSPRRGSPFLFYLLPLPPPYMPCPSFAGYNGPQKKSPFSSLRDGLSLNIDDLRILIVLP